MDRASAFETVDSRSIPSRVKQKKTIKIGILSFSMLQHSAKKKDSVKPPPFVVDR